MLAGTKRFFTLVLEFSIIHMPIQTGRQCLYPSPRVEKGELLMCWRAEITFACFQRAKPEAGWLNMTAMKSGGKCVKMFFCRCRGQV